MNRTQRRAQMRHDKRRHRMLESQKDVPMQIRHGHNGKQVVMQFSRPTEDLCMTPAQARALIESVEGALKMLEQHIAAQQKPALPPLAMAAANEGEGAAAPAAAAAETPVQAAAEEPAARG